MTVTVYRSTDAGAPQLNGVAGSLITVLDAVLVNGYGSKPAAGWTKPFSGTNKAVYRNSTVLGTGTYYRVRDDAPPAGNNGRYATVRGYETMTDVDTGAGAFPSLTQASEASGAVKWTKSTASDSASKSWTIVADERTVYLFVNIYGDATTNSGQPMMMGDIKSYMAVDPYCSVVCGNNLFTTSSSGWFPNTKIQSSLIDTQSSTKTAKIRRGHLGTFVESYDIAVIQSPVQSGYGYNSNQVPYPDPVTNALTYKRVIITCANAVRGEMRGLLNPSQDKPFMNGDTLTINGRTYLAVDCLVNGDSHALALGQVLIDITGPW